MSAHRSTRGGGKLPPTRGRGRGSQGAIQPGELARQSDRRHKQHDAEL
jgi:hypothetical protein